MPDAVAAPSPRTRASRRLRVALVGPSLDILGGQAVILQRLRERLEQSPALEVSFIAVNPRLPGILRLLQRVKFVRTVVTSVAYLASLARHLPRVDVVHAFSASYWSFLLAPAPAILLGRLFGKATILNYRSGEADDHLTNWRSAVSIARLAHAIVVPSGYLVGVFARHGLAATAIPNFVDGERLPFRERRGPLRRFFSNRNLEPLYNVGCTLRAFAHIQRAHPDAELTVAGDGQQRRALEQLARDLQLQHVRFVGRVSPEQMARLYAAADVYLNSPDIDNMPNSVIEAFASGLPVVTTDAGGIPFVVRHEENGLMVPAGDDRALAREALRLVGDPAFARQLALRARQECEQRYMWHAVAAAWEALYATTARLGGTEAMAMTTPSA